MTCIRAGLYQTKNGLLVFLGSLRSGSPRPWPISPRPPFWNVRASTVLRPCTSGSFPSRRTTCTREPDAAASGRSCRGSTAPGTSGTPGIVLAHAQPCDVKWAAGRPRRPGLSQTKPAPYWRLRKTTKPRPSSPTPRTAKLAGSGTAAASPRNAVPLKHRDRARSSRAAASASRQRCSPCRSGCHSPHT